MPTRRPDNDEERLSRLEAMMRQLREEHDRVVEGVKQTHEHARHTVERSRYQRLMLKAVKLIPAPQAKTEQAREILHRPQFD